MKYRVLKAQRQNLFSHQSNHSSSYTYIALRMKAKSKEKSIKNKQNKFPSDETLKQISNCSFHCPMAYPSGTEITF